MFYDNSKQISCVYSNLLFKIIITLTSTGVSHEIVSSVKWQWLFAF